MDRLHNPFSPGAGSPPPELAGRSTILDQALLALARIKDGRAEKSIFLIGLRGVGKTVLLHKISELAEEQGYKALMVEANESKRLPMLLFPYLRQVLFTLDMGEMVSAKVKRGLRVLGSFLYGLKVKIGETEFSLDIEPEKGSADSGDLEADLSQVFIALGEAAQDRGTAIAIIIDELQYLEEEELSSLIMATHKLSQKSLPIVVVGAGLPQLVGKAGNAKSYAERLFDYPEVGPLKKEDAVVALQEPVRSQGVAFTNAALDEIIRVTECYPYFLQEWGYHAWNIAEKSPIDTDVIHRATKEAIKRLDQNFFRVRFDRLTPREKQYLRALAELGHGAQRSGGIAEKLGLEVNSVAPLRSGLIGKMGPQLIQIKLVPGDKGEGKRLEASLAVLPPDGSAPKPLGDPQVLVEGITGGGFSYRGINEQGQPMDWQGDWKYTNNMPSVVTIKLVLEHGREWPLLSAPLRVSAAASQGPGNLLRGLRGPGVGP